MVSVKQQKLSRGLLVLIFLGMSIVCHASKKAYIKSRSQRFQETRKQEKKTVSDYFSGILVDAFRFHTNLISLETLKVAAAVVPSFFLVRHYDDKIHECFYNSHEHKNTNQMPGWTREVARVITGPTITFLALQGFLSKRSQDFYTAGAMVLGFPFLWYTNEFIKKIKMDCSLRPWNQHFSHKKRASGGFPSGHTAKIAYLATLYGLQYGWKAGLPLSLIAAGIGAIFIGSNRHYTSQIIAGVGIGVAYGIAAHKIVESKLSRDVTLSIAYSPEQGPALTMCWQF
jgi:membrane-associated phospholipid phosphatase